jgi:hypothetical protein
MKRRATSGFRQPPQQHPERNVDHEICARASFHASSTLKPVASAALTVLRQLREASPGGLEVEFGVDLSMQAGAVITKGEAGCHLKVKLTWTKESVDASASDVATATSGRPS